MRPISLSPRLRSVAELVPPGARLADVGTDHAYLPVWLLQQGIISNAIVSDLREGPIGRARSTAARYGLEERLSFRLCSGLDQIQPGEADTVVVAGMGGETIAAILAAAPWLQTAGCRLILQPMSAQDDLRVWLSGHGYRIERECLSREGETLYLALLVTPGEMEPFTPAECCAGRQTEGMRDPLRGDYLTGLIEKTARAVSGLQRASRLEDTQRLRAMETRLEGLRAMKEEWTQWQR